MQLKKSYFNFTIFKKTVIRFMPLWFLYALLMIFVFPVAIGSQLHYALLFNDGNGFYVVGSNLLSSALIMQYIMAILCVLPVMVTFSFMYFPKLTSGFCSLPVSREALFFSTTLAGFLPLILINAVTFAITYIVELVMGYAYLSAIIDGFIMMSLSLVFFYCFAVFCAQLTGNIVVLPIVYLVLNFAFYIVESVVRAILSYFVYGFSSMDTYANTFNFLSPFTYFNDRVGFSSVREYESLTSSYSTIGYELNGLNILLIYALVGLVVLALALMLFKRRKMEAAGDTISINILKPIFKICMTIGSGLCLGLLMYIAFTQGSISQTTAGLLKFLPFVFICCVIGHFAALMLINKSIAVFRGHKAIPNIIINFLLIVVLLFSFEFDLFGYEQDVPELSEIDNVYVSSSGFNTTFYEAENIELITAAHQTVVDNKSIHETGNERMYVNISYTLKDGTKLVRQYRLDCLAENSPDDWKLFEDILNTQESIDYRTALDTPINEQTFLNAEVRTSVLNETYDAETGEIYGYSEYENSYRNLTLEQTIELYYDCILPDLADGKFGRIWLMTNDDYVDNTYEANIYIDLIIPSDKQDDGTYSSYDSDYFSIKVTKYATRTVEYLENLGLTFITVRETGYTTDYERYNSDYEYQYPETVVTEQVIYD